MIRQENQPWDAVSCTYFLEVAGVGITGLTVEANIMRTSDTKFLQSDGTTWDTAAYAHALTEVSASGMPGFYYFNLAAGALSIGEERYGMSISTSHTGTDYLETLVVNVTPSVSFAADANTSVRNLTFNSRGEPTTGTIYHYANSTDQAADTAVDGTGAIRTETFIAVYDQKGQLLTMARTEV